MYFYNNWAAQANWRQPLLRAIRIRHFFGKSGAESEQGAIYCFVYFINTLRERGNKCHDMSSILVSGVIIRKHWDRRYRLVT